MRILLGALSLLLALCAQAQNALPSAAAATAPGAKPPSVPGGPQISDAEWAAYKRMEEPACAGEFYNKCAELQSKFLLAHWPQSQATGQELSQRCRDGGEFWADPSVKQYAEAPERRDSGGSRMNKWIGIWGGERFGFRVSNQDAQGRSCWDKRFVVSQWQRAVGRPETGKMAIADVDDFVTR